MYDSARKKKENIIMSESKQNFSIEVEGKRAYVLWVKLSARR
jgi:hypothetical protein